MPTPLTELKAWLAITTDAQDDTLSTLITTALELCESFTGEPVLTSEWSALPQGLRHGVIRLAAHLYRERDDPSGAAIPPAGVAALWQPWRQMRLT